VAGGTGASTALAARANLGLEIGVNVQAYDAGLASIAGLTTLADRSIYTTASDTYAVYTLTAAGRAILDDADAAAQRTTLGLGTAAVVNTGTGGATIPLLNAANTFSAGQTFTNDIFLNEAAGSSKEFVYQSGGLYRWVLAANSEAETGSNAGANFVIARFNDAGSFIDTPLILNRATGALAVAVTPTVNGNTVWHAGNDGSGSGLDADTLDGYNVGTSGATIPLLNVANTFSAAQGLSNNIALNILETGGAARSAVKMNTSNVMEFGNANNNASFLNNTVNFAGVGDFTRSGNTVWHAGNDGAGSGLDADTLDGVQGSAYATLSGATFTGDVAANKFSVGSFLMDDNIGLGADIPGFLFDANDWQVYYRSDNYWQFAIASNEVLRINSTGIKARPSSSAETTGTLTVASANTSIQATGDITIPNAVFAAGDIILIYAGASSRTITQGASVTMRLGGTSTTGSRTLAARGVAVLFFVSSSEVVVSGGAVT
jgi:hypothetical protein